MKEYEDLIRAEHVAKHFGQVTALQDVNLHVGKGEVLGLLGNNGAGKSTLLKILCGLHRQSSGILTIFGQSRMPARWVSIVSIRAWRWSTS